MKEDFWKELSEDKVVRTVNIHLHRFARFMRFLKAHDITVIKRQQDEKTGETYNLTYSSNKSSEHLSIKDLLMEAIDAPPSYWNTLTTRKLGLDDVHTEGDRKPTKLGKVIEAITISINGGDSLSNEMGSFLIAAEPFSTRRIYDNTHGLYSYYKSLGKDQRPTEWDHLLSDVFANTAGQVADNLPAMSDKRHLGAFQLISQDFQPFHGLAQEVAQSDPAIHFVRDNVIEYEYNASSKIADILQRISTYYHSFSNGSGNRKDIDPAAKVDEPANEATIIPGYWDFYYPHNRKATLELINRNNLKHKLLWLDEKNLHELIKYRYEILWLLIDLQYPVQDWSASQQSLLFLVLAEYRAAHNTIIHAAEWLTDDLRFTVLTSNGDKIPAYQKSALDVDALGEFLANYNFDHGLKQSFKIDDFNVLAKKLYRFPEPAAMKEKYSHQTIREHVKGELMEYLFYKIRDDLNIDNSMTY